MLSATQTSTLVNQKISWLSENPVGKNGNEADAWLLQDASTTFTPNGVSTASADDYVYYVAEYDSDEQCWSPGTKVTLHVVDNPVVTISSPQDICAVGTEPVTVTVSPETGTLTQESDFGSLNGTTFKTLEKPIYYEQDYSNISVITTLLITGALPVVIKLPVYQPDVRPKLSVTLTL